MRTVLTRTLMCAIAIFALAGCATREKRTLETDSAIKSVAVVSLMNEKTEVRRIGLTVFNNKSVVIDQTGGVNRTAIDTVEASLRTARPKWSIKDGRPEVPSMIAAQAAAGNSWTTHVSAMKKDLASLAKRLDVDLIFVVIEGSYENRHGRGVGIIIQNVGLIPPVPTAWIHSVCTLVLVDRNGEQIGIDGANMDVAFSQAPAAALGIDWELNNLTQPAMQEKLKGLMQDRLKASLKVAASKMGY